MSRFTRIEPRSRPGQGKLEKTRGVFIWSLNMEAGKSSWLAVGEAGRLEGLCRAENATVKLSARQV